LDKNASITDRLKQAERQRGEAEMSLDNWLDPTVVKPKSDTGITVEERCSNPKCRKILKPPTIIYRLRIKGKIEPYCQECAKAKLRPQENSEENL